MENSNKFFLNNIETFIKSVFAEGYIVLFMLGLIIVIIGLFFIIATLMPIILRPPLVKAIVAGAVRPDIKRTSEDNEVTTKKGELFPIFKYTQEDGTSTLIRGSSGGTHVHKYKTGQAVNLIINKGSIVGEKETATDNADMTGLYFGFSFLAVGGGMIYMAWRVLSLLSLGFVSMFAIFVSLIVSRKINKKRKFKVEKVFDFSKMRSVEEFKRK